MPTVSPHCVERLRVCEFAVFVLCCLRVRYDTSTTDNMYGVYKVLKAIVWLAVGPATHCRDHVVL